MIVAKIVVYIKIIVKAMSAQNRHAVLHCSDIHEEFQAT